MAPADDVATVAESQWHRERCPLCGRMIEQRTRPQDARIIQARHRCPHHIECGVDPMCPECEAAKAGRAA